MFFSHKNNYYYSILIAILIAALSDFVFVILNTAGNDTNIIKILVYFTDTLLLAFGFYLSLVYKILPRIILISLIILIILILLYLPFAIFDETSYVAIAKTIRNLLLPFSIILMGYIAGYINISEIVLVKIFFSIAVLISLYGTYELYFLDVSFFFKYLNIGEYYYNIKGLEAICPPFHCGTFLSKNEFSFLGSDRRISGIFLEPLTTGIYLSSGLVLALYYYFFRIKFINTALLFSFSLIIFYAILLTQSRSAIIVVVITLVPAILSSYTKKLSLNIIYIIITLIMISTGLYYYFEESTYTLGGKGGHQEDIFLFINLLANSEYYIGKGIGHVPVQHSGYAKIYTQFGYLGLSLCILFIINIIFLHFRHYNAREPLVLFSIGTMSSTAIIFNFSSYPFSFKGYMIIWFILGYSLYKISLLKAENYLNNKNIVY
jgi:hypothetical protein